MIDQVIESLDINPDGIYLDLTVGYGGHSSLILKKLSSKGMLIGFDQDINAINYSEKKLSKISKNFKLINSNFKNLKEELKKLNIIKVDGILADLGVSSVQFDESERGFSYNKEAKIDMRMNQSQKISGYDVVNSYNEEQLAKIFLEYADVKLNKRVANAIVSNRPIETTLELANIIRTTLPSKAIKNKNIVRQVFQAIRIEVNDELESLRKMIEDAILFLKKNAKLAIITFHSLEDRIVKQEFKKFLPQDLGDIPIEIERKFKSKQFKPKEEEIQINPRARSAKLRILTKL